MTKGGLVVGGAYGRGAVYEQGQHIGYADLPQGSVGLQAGAQTPMNHRSQTAIWSSTASTTFDPVGPAV
jgi:hypothetical protein